MATYPTPLQMAGYDEGPFYVKYLKLRKDYSEITLVSVFEDQGRHFNLSADAAPQRWEITYAGLTDNNAQIIDDFWNVHRLHVSFTFVEPRDEPWTGVEGTTYTGVRFESYEKDHDQVKDQQKRTVRLVRYPV